MALPTNIPTSFVPHSATASRRFRTDLTGAFDFFAYGALGIVFVLALGVFFYGRVLAASQSTKDAALAEAVKGIDRETIEDFVKLRNRLTSGKILLANHTALSGFFTLFETLVPATVRFVSLDLSIDEMGTIALEGSGVAKSFNALAAASTAFAKDGRIKDAIFSSIVVNSRDSSVAFALSAVLDQKLIAFSPSAASVSPGGNAPKTATTSTQSLPKATTGTAPTTP